MALDGKLLALAKAALDEKRRSHDELFERRTRQVYARTPSIQLVDAEIKATMMDLIGASIASDDTTTVDQIRQKNLELQEHRRRELLLAGFPEDYLDDDYMCPDCRDSGYAGMQICTCLMELYKEELKKSLSHLLKLGDETFESFDLTYYDDRPTIDTEVSPRRSMEMIYKTCLEYAKKFGSKSVNLFFNGGPGLGKTFLSACIARVVSDNGHSVIYDTASSIFAKFEDAKFSQSEDIKEAARRDVKRYLECDLLILDDLGTEMLTSLIVSSLYEIVNSRLVTGRKTIISTNLTVQEMYRRYSEQIASRIDGEYQKLTFRGEDIRKKRNAI